MTEFRYRCIDFNGKEVGGDLSAADIKDAKSTLRQRGFTVIDLSEKPAATRRFTRERKRIKDDDLYNLFRELSIIARAGVKIDSAFEMVINSVSSSGLKAAISGILKDIRSGRDVSEAFINTGKFSHLIPTMIKVGENMGDLGSAFENIASYMRFQIDFKNEIKNALTYPVFLVFASIVTLLVIFNFILPRFFSIFGAGSAASLPYTTRFLYTMSRFLTFTNVMSILAAGAVMFVIARKTPYIKGMGSKLSEYILFIPFLGRLFIYLELSRFSFSMHSMLRSGMAFINALKSSISIIQNNHLRGSMGPVVNQIKEGKKIADVFSQVSLLPDIMPNMLRVGEGSGNLEEIFLELHRIFDERFKNRVKRILILLEPTIIVIMGIIVGFIVISLILTVMNVGNIKL